jgi:tetratricopeptide (TPR) repeat protein
MFPALYDTLTGSHYEAAWEIQDSLDREFPDDPATLFARAIILYTAMVDFEDTTGEAEFFSCCDEATLFYDKQINTATDSQRLWLEFIQGSVHATRGFYLGRRGDFWSAIKQLSAAKSLFSQVLKQDPCFYDAYLGRGAYRYGIAQHAGILSNLPFLPSRKAAYHDLTLAVDSSKFSRYAAMSALAWFLIEERNYAEAESLIAKGLARFPQARSFLWPLIALQFRTDRYRECIASSIELMQQYLASPRNNGYDVVGLYKRMAEAAMELGDDEAVVQYCTEGLEATITEDAKQRRSRDLQRLETWLEKAQKRLEQSKAN